MKKISLPKLTRVKARRVDQSPKEAKETLKVAIQLEYTHSEKPSFSRRTSQRGEQRF